MVWQCEFCGEVLKTKAKLIKHIRGEREECVEIEYNAADDILECDRILEELEAKK